MIFFLGKDLIRNKTAVSTDINNQTSVNYFWEDIFLQTLVFELRNVIIIFIVLKRKISEDFCVCLQGITL